MGIEKGPEFYTGQGYIKDAAKENNMLIYKEAYKLLPDPKECLRVVDLGCGVGYFAELINNHAYVGIDFSPHVLRIAKKNNPKKSFILADLNIKTKQYVKNCTYVCLETLEHIKDDLEVIRKIPSGSLIICSLPNRDFTSHVRFFKNQNEIIERYKKLIDFDNCTWRIIETNPKKDAKVFMFKARRK